MSEWVLTPRGRCEALGVRVRDVSDLWEGALYFRKRGLVLIDALMDSAGRDAVLADIADERDRDREVAHQWARELGLE